ncbi:type 4 pilus major pilin [Trinickia fusca]|nr:type 4 pilus major pilin [Trinickia fusca]
MVKCKKLFRKRREQGLTLIEASMVLALSAVVVAGVMLYYQSASDNNRLQSALGELGSIQTAVQTLYAGQSDYTNLSNVVLKGNSSIPPSMQDATTGDLKNPWNGAVTVAVDAVKTNYDVTFEGIPVGACAAFASQQLGSQMVSISVNGATTPSTTPLSPSDAQTACNTGAAANGLAKIEWVLK